MSTGSKWFGIKPYPVLITAVHISAKGNRLVLLFDAYTDFKQVHFGWEVFDSFAIPFAPQDIQITPALEEYVKKQGGILPSTTDSVVIPVNQIQRRLSMDTRSECPGFLRHWDPDVSECKDCAKVFQDEYVLCKKAVLDKRAKVSAPVGTTTVERKEPVEKKDVTSVPACFRPGSRAAILADFLKGNKPISFEVASEFLQTTCQLDKKLAQDTVKNYLYEWKKGSWGGKQLPFIVVVEGDNLTYQEK